MKLRRLIRLASLNISTAKQRSVLAVLGILIGIASVIAMVSLGLMARAEAALQFSLLGTDILTLRAERQPRRVQGFGLLDVATLKKLTPLVEMAAPRIESSLSVRCGSNSENRNIFGVSWEELQVHHLHLREGRFLLDFDSRDRVCVLGDDIARILANTGNRARVGDWLKILGQPFQIVGILGHKEVGAYGNAGINEVIYLPIAVAMKLSETREISTVVIRTPAGIPPARAAARLVDVLRVWKGDSVKFELETPEALLRQMEDTLRLYTLLLGIIASISLVVGGVGVMNVMLVSVTERRKEIGVRRALGARRRDIQSQFLTESVMLTLAGGAAGSVVGTGAAWIVATTLGWHLLMPLEPVALGLAVASTLGVFFGWYPARKAAGLLPVEALRS